MIRGQRAGVERAGTPDLKLAGEARHTAAMTPARYSDRAAARRALIRHCSGAGVELGPGHLPFPLPYPGTTAQYVDRWLPEASRSLFPELGAAAEFPQPDIVADLDQDRLSALAEGSQEFVIASHVLEHVADPIGLLADIHRVLRPGGTLLLLLPDRRKTFDVGREPTPLDHLVREFRQDVRQVDDEHIEQFLRGTGGWDDSLEPAEREAVIKTHRSRSIHAHCWTESEWPAVMEFCIRELGQTWELVDVLNVEDVPASNEFGMVLRRALSKLDAAARHSRFAAVLAELGPTGVGEVGQDENATPEQLRAASENWRRQAEHWQQLATERHRKLSALSHSPLGPALHLAWRVRERIAHRE